MAGLKTVIEIVPDPEEKKGRRKGVIAPDLYRDDLARRRRTSGKFVNYYDRGQLANGDDIDFCIVPSVTSIFFFNIGSRFENNPYHVVDGVGDSMTVNTNSNPTQFVFDQMDFADAMNTELFSVPVGSWADTFKKIEGVENAQYDLNGTGLGSWTAGRGYAVDPTVTNIAVGSLIHFNTFNTGGVSEPWTFRSGTVDDTTISKITTEQNYDAAAVPFVMDEDCDVFLTPAMTFWWGCAADLTLAGETWILDAVYQPMSREASIGNANWHDIRNPAYGARFFKEDFPVAMRSYWRGLAESSPGSRVLYLPPGGTIGDITSGAFPIDNFINDHNRAVAPFLPYFCVKLIDCPPGVCLAAIKKGDEWYYVWNTHVVSLDNNNLHYGGFI